MTIAKRDAAKRGLYSRFFRGPVLGPETLAEEEKRLTALVVDAFAEKGANVESVKVTEHIEVQTVDERVVVDLEVSKSSLKKRKTREAEGLHVKVRDDEDEEARRERKRQRKEEKRKKEEKKEREMKEEKKKRTAKESGMSVDQTVHMEGSISSTKRQKKKAESEDEEMEYKRRKEEKKKAKALRKLESNEAKEMATVENIKPNPSKNHLEKDSPSRHLSKREVAASMPAEDLTDEVKKKKKKRKHTGNSEESN
jgi:hypothetical protein